MAAKIKVRNPKRLTDLELEAAVNIGLDDSDLEVFDSDEDSDVEPEQIEEIEDIITTENDEPGLNINQFEDNLGQDVEGSALYYTSKSGITWNKIPFRQKRRRVENIIRKKAGLTQYSCNISSELDSFLLFLTPEILDIIVTHTNIRAEQVIMFTFLLYYVVILRQIVFLDIHTLE